MYEREWDELLERTIYRMIKPEENELNELLDKIINSIHSDIIVVDNQYLTKPMFKNYLYNMFMEGKRLSDIKYYTYEQRLSGLAGQTRLDGKIQYTFQTEGGGGKKKKERVLLPPTQQTLEGEKKQEKIMRQKFFEAQFIISGIPELYEHQEEAIQAIREKKRISIQIPTGLGKTLIGIEAIRRFGTPAIVIVPSVALIKQWEDEMKKYGITPSVVYSEDRKFGIVTIATYQMARMEKYRSSLRMYRVVIFDEVHHLYGDITQTILYEILDTAEYIIGLSATVKEPHEKGYVVQETYIPTAIKKYPSDFHGTPLEVPLEIVYVPVYLSPSEREDYENAQLKITRALKKLGPPSRWSEVAKSDNEELRNLALSALKALHDRRRVLSENISKMNEAIKIISSENRQFLVFVETINAARMFSNMLSDHGISNAVITSDVSVEDRHRYFLDFKKGKIQVLISVFVLEEGINLPDVDRAIWLATTRDTPRYMIQRIGRITRPKPGKIAKLYWIYAVGTVEEDRIHRYGRLL
jgi:superfamily II DNA or RNA helicase